MIVLRKSFKHDICFLSVICACAPVCVCVKVAKSHGDPEAQNRVAYLWAHSLGGEAAVKLLNKFGLLEFAIETASNKW